MNEPCPQCSEKERFDPSCLGIVSPVLLAVGLVFTGASLVWGLWDRSQFAFSWMMAFLVCFTLCAGSFFWLILHHTIDANWTVVARRILETKASMVFPWLLLAFVPVLLNLGEIFAWWNTPKGVDTVLDHKSGYLNHTFFLVRAGIYFLFFGGVAGVLLKISVKQDESGDPFLSIRMRQWSYFGMFFFAIFITTMSVDWLMGLNSHWYSTIFGVYIFAASAVGSMAALILVVNGLRAAGYLRGLATAEHNHAMGKLLFGLNVFWAYVAFCQYMLYYYANVPEETTFYITRNTGSWHAVSLLLVFGHFFIPFVVLLSQAAKRHALPLCLIAGWLLLMHVVEIYWIVMPQMQLRHVIGEGSPAHLAFRPHPLDLTCLIGLFSLLGYFFMRRLAGAAIYPMKDPRLQESIALTN